MSVTKEIETPLEEDEMNPHSALEHSDVQPTPQELQELNPKPNLWPFVLSMVAILVPLGTVMLLWAESQGYQRLGWGLLILGGILMVIPTMGWAHSVIVDKWEGHFGAEAQGADLTLGTKLFFLSEIAVFGSLFAYYFMQRYHMHVMDMKWPPSGTPEIPLFLPMVGLLILLTSSVTCEFAHKAMLAGKRSLCKDWLWVTMILGLVFLFLQGYEWGILIAYDGFYASTNWFGTLFYAITGFHGLHVMTGLLMLMVVYGRVEMGHYTRKRHFSMQAASWYWHLVDVVWIFVFAFIYVMSMPGAH